MNERMNDVSRTQFVLFMPI